MKKFIVSFALILAAATSFAQSEKYLKAMKDKVPAVDTLRTLDGLNDLSASFERIGDAEKTQWLPYYYAALSQVNGGLMLATTGVNTADKLDPIADKAETLLNKAEALSKDNAEIFIVKKMIATLRMMTGQMERYQQYGPASAAALATAKKLSPDNPRVYLLEGQDQFFTPEQFGGSKTEAKKLFEKAQAKFESFKPASDIDPNWGRPTLQYFMAQVK